MITDPIQCSDRVTLKDFTEEDRMAFCDYQCDPRYLGLYDYPPDGGARASALFDLFVSWQSEQPRRNFQLGVYDRAQRLMGCAGLRLRDGLAGEAVIGVELAPAHWGRYRVALDVVEGLARYGFERLRLDRVVGDTSSGNTRVAKLARVLGADLVDVRPGPEWMTRRNWQEVDYALTAETWRQRHASAVADGRGRRMSRG